MAAATSKSRQGRVFKTLNDARAFVTRLKEESTPKLNRTKGKEKTSAAQTANHDALVAAASGDLGDIVAQQSKAFSALLPFVRRLAAALEAEPSDLRAAVLTVPLHDNSHDVEAQARRPRMPYAVALEPLAQTARSMDDALRTLAHHAEQYAQYRQSASEVIKAFDRARAHLDSREIRAVFEDVNSATQLRAAFLGVALGSQPSPNLLSAFTAWWGLEPQEVDGKPHEFPIENLQQVWSRRFENNKVLIRRVWNGLLKAGNPPARLPLHRKVLRACGLEDSMQKQSSSSTADE